MKKFMSLLMASVLVIGLFSGCDEKPGDSSSNSPEPASPDVSAPAENSPAENPPAPAAPASGVDLSEGEYEEGGDWGYQGDVMHTYWFNFAVDDAYTCASYEGYTPAEGNQLLVVHIAMKNTVTSSVTMYNTDFQAQWGDDSDENAYAWPISTNEGDMLWDNEIHIDELLSDDQLPAEYDIPVNGETDGLLIYEVPVQMADGTAVKDFSVSYQEWFAGGEEGDVYFVYFTPEAK